MIDLEEESRDRPEAVGCLPRAAKHAAMRVSKLNRIGVIVWINRNGGSAKIAPNGVALMSPGRCAVAYPGDWVVFTGAGFSVIQEQAFGDLFYVRGEAPRKKKEATV